MTVAGIRQGLTLIFVFQFGILGVKLCAIRVCGQCLEYVSDSQPRAANARLAVVFANRSAPLPGHGTVAKYGYFLATRRMRLSGWQ